VSAEEYKVPTVLVTTDAQVPKSGAKRAPGSIPAVRPTGPKVPPLMGSGMTTVKSSGKLAAALPSAPEKPAGKPSAHTVLVHENPKLSEQLKPHHLVTLLSLERFSDGIMLKHVPVFARNHFKNQLTYAGSLKKLIESVSFQEAGLVVENRSNVLFLSLKKSSSSLRSVETDSPKEEEQKQKVQGNSSLLQRINGNLLTLLRRNPAGIRLSAVSCAIYWHVAARDLLSYHSSKTNTRQHLEKNWMSELSVVPNFEFASRKSSMHCLKSLEW
jgi:hypothetical protein